MLISHDMSEFRCSVLVSLAYVGRNFLDACCSGVMYLGQFIEQSGESFQNDMSLNLVLELLLQLCF